MAARARHDAARTGRIVMPRLWAGAKLDGLLAFEIVGVELDEVLPLRGDGALLEDRREGAGWLTGAAVDALLGVDIEQLDRLEVRLALRRVNAVNRADIDTRGVLSCRCTAG